MNIRTKLFLGIGLLAGMIVLLVAIAVINLQLLTATEPDSPAALLGLQRALSWIAVMGCVCILVGIGLLVWLPRSIHRSMIERLKAYRATTLNDTLSAKTFLEAVVNSIHEPIIGLNREHEILFINKEALSVLGLKQEDMTAFGISMSMMNVQAYGIAAVMPAEGKEEAVTQALQGYIDQQKAAFENYLADQYEIAGAARLETLSDGTVLMVMCSDQDTVFDAIKTAIEA